MSIGKTLRRLRKKKKLWIIPISRHKHRYYILEQENIIDSVDLCCWQKFWKIKTSKEWYIFTYVFFINKITFLNFKIVYFYRNIFVKKFRQACCCKKENMFFLVKGIYNIKHGILVFQCSAHHSSAAAARSKEEGKVSQFSGISLGIFYLRY